MSECQCTPNQFPFHCAKYGTEMGYNDYEACRKQGNTLARLKQEREQLQKLRETPCAHLGPVVDGTIHSCTLYGQCTKVMQGHGDMQSCDLCPDHTAVAQLVSLSDTMFGGQFVPFDGGKGGTAGCSTDGCDTIAPCNWSGSANACPPSAPPLSTSCYCLTIAALDTDCSCLAGDYILNNTVFTAHTWGVFEDPVCDGPLSVTLDDSADPSGCLGCGSGNQTTLAITCTYGTNLSSDCISLCGTATSSDLDVTGRGIVCCGCIEVTVTSC